MTSIKTLHVTPRSRSRGTVPVVVPVAPSHQALTALESSLAAAAGADLTYIVVLNGVTPHQTRPEAVVKAMSTAASPLLLLDLPEPCGYVRAVRAGLNAARNLPVRKDLVGFLDADTALESPAHWSALEELLEARPDLMAVSGMVVHAACRPWEALSSQPVIDALSSGSGRPLTKPYLQGGAGGTLARRAEFDAAVEWCLRRPGAQIGPALSAAAIAQDREVFASSALATRHTVRATFAEWAASISGYEQSWRMLTQHYGTGIRDPWQRFLVWVNHALKDRPDLAAAIDLQLRMRRQVTGRRLNRPTDGDAA